MFRLPTSPRMLMRYAAVSVSVALCYVGCDGENKVTNPGTGSLAIIVVTPNPNSVDVGAQLQFVATGQDANGFEVEIPAAVTWSVVAGGGVIDADGQFTAGASAGTFANTVQATSGDISGFASVSVASGPLATITVTPNPVSVLIAGSVEFSATGRDADGNIVPIAPTWSVVNATAGTITPDGVFTAGTTPATYTATVLASSGLVSDAATVTVAAAAGVLASITINPNPASVPVNSARQFTASGQDANGVVVPIAPAPTWSVVNGGGVIDGVSGSFTAGVATGSFPNTIKAASGAVSGHASVGVTSAASAGGPSLGTASPFAVLGSTAISCVGVSDIAGNVGVAPAGSVSGFPAPCTISSPGKPTPQVNNALAKVAQADVTPAYNALAAMPCGTGLTGQDLGGKTLAPGVYCFTSSAHLTGTVTLAGPANGTWVFQITSALTTGTSAEVILSGGALAKNVFWQVGSSATIGQTTAFQGNIIAAVSVTLVQGATLHGRALSKAGVTMDGNQITLP